MKAGSNLFGAVSAAALSVGISATAVTTGILATSQMAQAATVSRIDVRGNNRVDDASVRNYVVIQPGQNFNNDDIDESIKRLFATGLFSDVRISQAGGALVVSVVEYSLVNQVLFQGNSKIKDAQLATIVQTEPAGALNQLTIDADVQAIRDAYSAKGRSDATVSSRLVKVDENRVNVIFDVNEGDRTKIGAINFVGNQAYGDRRLRDVITTRRSGILSFLSRNDVYDETRLRADEEMLRRFYFNRGYADFRVISSTGTLDDASNEYSITFTVDEGERYTFGAVNIDSTVPGIDTQGLNRAVETRAGEVYSAEEVEDTIIALSDRVADSGAAFAQVTPRGDRDFANRTISVDYVIEEGPRTYIERIEIRGNTRTRDYVIRREFDVSEGDAFNQILIRRAQKRLEALGYFESVNISTAPGSQPDRVVLVVEVVDQSTGEFSIGAGYESGGDSGGAVGELAVTERNFLGRGQFIKAAVGAGSDTRTYSFSFTEPYFLGRRVAAGFDLARSENSFSDYDVTRTSGSVRLSAPLARNLRGQISYNLSQEEYDGNDCTGVYATGIAAGVPNCTETPVIDRAIVDSPWIKSSLAYTLTYDTLDDRTTPRDGIFVRFSQEFAGLGGDAEFIQTVAKATYYRTLLEDQDVVGLVSAGAGNVTGFGDDNLRVFDHMFAGPDIIRGFRNRGIGPRYFDGDDFQEAVGGTTYFNTSAELQFPLPAIPQSFGLRGALFADAATLYGNDTGGANIVGTDMEWRASLGASLIWASPFGPLRVDYAVPVVQEEYDIEENFRFGISSRF